MYNLLLILLMVMLVMWHIDKTMEEEPDSVVVHVPVPVPVATQRTQLPTAVKEKLIHSDLVSIYDPVKKLHLNVTNNCVDISLNPSMLCLKWGTVKLPFQYSSFRMYIPAVYPTVITVGTPMYLYAPYLNVWFSNNAADGNLSTISPTSEIRLANSERAEPSVYAGVRYKINTESGFFDSADLVFTKINFV